MTEFSHIVYEAVIWFFLLYATGVLLVYSWMGIYALGAILQYKRENTFTDYSIIASNPNAPIFSLIAPAYNEGMTIVENVRSLLSLFYHNLEIIIVNDGSKDDSIQKLIEAYELECISFFIQGDIPTAEVRGVYKSKNPAFKKLIVVDKANGGKADALNVGVNISGGDYLVCIDVDCILEQDAILKLAKPFLQQTDKKLIACGGVIRLANNCRIENGKVVEVNLPRTLLGRTQVLEYIRAFVLGRMAWSRASGLILISGAFGVFDRKIVLACGGYDKNTVGEDMELVVRMRQYMEERNEAYEVITIPDPLCWTEAPESKEILVKQRNRWMRGTMETLWKHRKMMFNPKYGKLGTVSLPYWFTFEFLGPLIEFAGYFFFILFLILGIINWSFFLVLCALVISAGFLYSFYAILVDLVSRQVYTKRKDFLSLISTALLEPFYFHPIVVKAGVKGFVDYFKKSHSWGEMTRQGFNQEVNNLPWGKRMLAILKFGLQSWGAVSSVFILFFLLTVGAEWVWYHYAFDTFKTELIALPLLLDNLLFAFRILLGLGVGYLLLNFVKAGWARNFALILFSAMIIFQFVLFIYFSESGSMLGADIQFYTKAEIMQTLESGGMLSLKNMLIMLILAVTAIIPFYFAGRTSFKTPVAGITILSLGILSFFIPRPLGMTSEFNEFGQMAAKSKWENFFSSNSNNYLNRPEIAGLLGQSGKFNPHAEMLDKDYPFWKKEDTPDFLGPLLTKSDKTPNLVLIVMEGFGHAYTSHDGYIGNFAPFLDSLSGKGLVWDQALSSSGRTFGALPTLTGSLPFGQSGFLEIDKTPPHFNLFNVLKKNGFTTGFYYGGQGQFDKMDRFVKFSGADNLIDQTSFSKGYSKLPSKNGESWGYEDQAVFSKMLDTQPVQNRPYFNTVFTLSTHSPFLINSAGYYGKKFNAALKSPKLNKQQRDLAAEHKKQLTAMLNADDALRELFANYRKRADFANTIFVITGDHSMPEVILQSKIDRFRVPLVIYSDMVKQPKRFNSMVSHFDVAPTLLAYYRNNYNLSTPKTVAWIGDGLKGSANKAGSGIPIMKSKDQLQNFVFANYHLQDKQVFRLTDMQEDPVSDLKERKKVLSYFNNFRAMNNSFTSSNKLIPDSTVVNFFRSR